MMQIQTRVIINDDVLGRTAGELRGEHCGARASMIIETTAQKRGSPDVSYQHVYGKVLNRYGAGLHP